MKLTGVKDVERFSGATANIIQEWFSLVFRNLFSISEPVGKLVFLQQAKSMLP